MRIIDADNLKTRIRAIFASENGSKRVLPDAPLQIALQTIECWIDTEPEVQADKTDPKIFEAYERGFNAGAKTQVALMTSFAIKPSSQEEEQ